jgi:hypothetical protein
MISVIKLYAAQVNTYAAITRKCHTILEALLDYEKQ